jgi:hypothetical protein
MPSSAMRAAAETEMTLLELINNPRFMRSFQQLQDFTTTEAPILQEGDLPAIAAITV